MFLQSSAFVHVVKTDSQFSKGSSSHTFRKSVSFFVQCFLMVLEGLARSLNSGGAFWTNETYGSQAAAVGGQVKCSCIMQHFNFSSVTNNSSPEWSRFPSPSLISSNPFVNRNRITRLTVCRIMFSNGLELRI